MVIDAPVAQERIKPIEAVLSDSYATVVDRWFELVTENQAFAKPLSPTTRAGFIHDHVCPEIEAGIAEIPDVYATTALGFFALRLGPEILMRLKYVGQGAPSNVATDQQKLLARQQYDEEMVTALGCDPALAPPTLLTCGYTLGDGKLGRVEIRCEYKGKQLWSFDIYGGKAVSAPLEFTGTEHEAVPAIVKSSRKTAAEKEQGLAEEA